MTMFIIDNLKSACKTSPENIALVCGNKSISYQALDNLSEEIALGLKSAGVVAGDNVGIHMDKSVQAIASIYAILKLGCCYVPISPDSPEPRFMAIIKNCSIAHLLIEEQQQSVIETLLLDTGVKIFSTKQLIDFVKSDKPDPIIRAEITGQESAAILHTSGSTGVPKGAVITQQNLSVFISWSVSAFALTADDRLLSHAPLQFDLSFFDLFAASAVSATVVLTTSADTSNAARLVSLVNDSGITVWQSVPSALTLLVVSNKLQKQSLFMPNVRCVLFAGERMPRTTLLGISEIFSKAVFYNIYGCTETNNTFMYQLPSDVSKAPDPLPIGSVLTHIQHKVVDESGAEVKPGKKGQLVIAGDTVMAGYIERENTGKSIYRNDNCVDGFYQTHDIVSASNKGEVCFHGRVDNVIKSNGYRINLMEIEDQLRHSQKFVEVAVMCEPDELIGNRIIAIVKPKPSESCSILDLKLFCAKSLPKYAIPHRFYISSNALPKGNTGKIDKRQIAEMWQLAV